MIDLHTHSTASDGILHPAELIRRARDSSIRVLALTDHDTFDGIDEAEATVREFFPALKFIAGCEFSIDYEGGDFHLLGYGIRPEGICRDLLDSLKQSREERIVRMIENLRSFGFGVSMEDLPPEVVHGSPGKPHIARLLIAKGYAEDMRDAFNRFMCEGCPGYVPKRKVGFDEAVNAIRASGGYAVLAHPATLRLEGDRFSAFIADLASRGMSGIEAYSSVNPDPMVERCIDLAGELGLFVTGGSDYHGDHDERLGFYRREHVIPTAKIIAGLPF